jgi:carbon storage regulator CsrA
MNGKLVLSRKNDEGVTITLENGEKIHIGVTIKAGNQVALAFDAPRNVEINRDEIEERKNNGVPFVKEPKIINKRPRSSSKQYS